MQPLGQNGAPAQPWQKRLAFNPIRERSAASRIPPEQHSPGGGKFLPAAGGRRNSVRTGRSPTGLA